MLITLRQRYYLDAALRRYDTLIQHYFKDTPSRLRAEFMDVYYAICLPTAIASLDATALVTPFRHYIFAAQPLSAAATLGLLLPPRVCHGALIIFFAACHRHFIVTLRRLRRRFDYFHADIRRYAAAAFAAATDEIYFRLNEQHDTRQLTRVTRRLSRYARRCHAIRPYTFRYRLRCSHVAATPLSLPPLC